MKNLAFTFLFLLSASFSIQAQIKKTTAIPKTTTVQKIDTKALTKATQIQAIEPIHLKDMPFFDGIQPIGGSASSLPVVDKDLLTNNQYRPVGATVTLPEISAAPANVNGELSARENYMGSQAYLTFIGADVDPRANKVDCKCGSGLTYVIVNFLAEEGKRYLLTYNLSTKYRDRNARVGVFTNNFLQNFVIDQENELIDIVVRPGASGMVQMWMQCTDPNNSPTPWVFNNVTIQKVD
jgi:hypothetical protein